MEIINEATGEGIKATGVEARLLLCTLRHYSEAQSMQTVELVNEFKGTYVAGFDIAGDEAGFPLDNHIDAYDYAHKHSISCTAHAGEARGADSVWETLDDFHPTRIGHGVRSAEDDKLLDLCKKDDIHLEVCPTSNVKTNVVATIPDHKADYIYNYGVSMSINTDARTISDTTLTKEYGLMEKTFNWNKEHFLKCNLEAIRHSFIPEELKASLRSRIEKAYAEE